ncbi:hypothetical protein BRAO285_850051 [Bradyrhizobium sp. ORS 285]|nr:hypothetical protein BRAO285_850051 [Bradyrhizobium sp. ORS 285]
MVQFDHMKPVTISYILLTIAFVALLATVALLPETPYDRQLDAATHAPSILGV